MKDVSVIIVNYNTKDLLSDCLDSIYRHTKDIDFEVIVVDNDSHDGSKSLFANDNRVIFVDSGGNVGFGRANNKGVQIAKGKFLFLLNSDTILHNNAIKIMRDYYVENEIKKNLGVIGTYLLNRNGEIGTSACNFIYFTEPLRFMKAKILRLMHRPWQEDLNKFEEKKVDAVTGADMFMSAKVFNDAGEFDPIFFMYGEEVELQKRIANMGKNNYLIPGPSITHLEGGSTEKTKGLPFFTFYSILCGNYIFALKHFNMFEKFILASLNFILLYLWTFVNNRFTIEENSKLRKLLIKPYNIDLYNISQL